jgi:hypothetical protein
MIDEMAGVLSLSYIKNHDINQTDKLFMRFIND